MTIKQALTEVATKLLKNKTKFPRLEAEILLSHILKKPREYLFTHPETELTQLQITNYELQIKRRIQGEPIAYITGEKEFYGLKFLVNKNVLIPRPETELMVDAALAMIKKNSDATIIDVGAGSGCIIVALAKAVISNYQFLISNQTPKSKIKFFATDISIKALEVATRNAKLNKVAKYIKFKNGNLLKPLRPELEIRNSKLEIICSNLPYLTPAQIKNSPTIKHEPKLALSAGKDGLKYYRKLFSQINPLRPRSEASKLSRLSGTPPKAAANYIILCEIDPSQKTSIRRLAKSLLPPHEFTLKKDLRGHNRLAIISDR